MSRTLIPGTWGRCGRAIPDAQVSELDNVVPIRPEVTFPAPKRSKEDNEYRAKALITILAIDALAFAAMGFLIWMF